MRVTASPATRGSVRPSLADSSIRLRVRSFARTTPMIRLVAVFPSHRWRAPVVALLVVLAPVATAGQEPRLAAGYWTRGLVGGWGHGWKHGIPGYGKTETDVRFVAFHPQLGRFVTDHLEIYGEGTLLLYRQPAPAVSAGLAGLGGRYPGSPTGTGAARGVPQPPHLERRHRRKEPGPERGDRSRRRPVGPALTGAPRFPLVRQAAPSRREVSFSA